MFILKDVVCPSVTIHIIDIIHLFFTYFFAHKNFCNISLLTVYSGIILLILYKYQIINVTRIVNELKKSDDAASWNNHIIILGIFP